MTNPPTTEAGVAITVDGREVLARPGELVIDACERTGTYIPRFCHHPRMQPVGMCRMCLVEVDTGRGPALQPSCVLECTPGMVVDTESEVTRKAQDGVLEFLLVNHPLDCPVCDKGGECPLQDQTMAFGPGESRFVEEKRHFEKPIPINDNVHLDRERCILCDRCTRFADQVAGDPLIHFLGRGSRTQINTYPDRPFSSYFSGNTVQICPVGALTAAPYRFKARPWDLTEVESTSTLDSVGARIAVQASHDRVLRFLGVDADAVNWGWLSDKERFVFEAYGSEDRLGEPRLRQDNGTGSVRASWSEAMERCVTALGAAEPDRVAVLGGARLTNEAQYAWARLAKGVIGTDHVDAQLADGLPAQVVLGLPRATIDDACTPGGIIVLLGPDPKEELGTLYLRLRHAVVHDGCTLIELTPQTTGLSGQAAHSIRVPPGAAPAAVATMCGKRGVKRADLPSKELAAAGRALAAGGPVTVLVGRSSLAEGSGPTVDAALALHDHLPDARFLSLLRRGNIHGALDMGLSPGLLPGRATLEAGRDRALAHWPTLPSSTGHDALGILEAAAEGRIDVLVLLGADILGDVPDHDLARRALDGAGTVIAVDLFATPTTDRADILLPAAAPTELDGSFTNLEGRITVIRQKVTPPGTARPDWMIAVDLADRLGAGTGPSTPDELWAELAEVSLVHADIGPAVLEASAREGVLVVGRAELARPKPTSVSEPGRRKVRLVVTRSMYDRGVLVAHSPSLVGLAPGTRMAVAPDDLERLGLTDGEKVRAVGARGELAAEVIADAGTAPGTVHLLWNQDGPDPGDLIDASRVVTDLKLERR